MRLHGGVFAQPWEFVSQARAGEALQCLRVPSFRFLVQPLPWGGPPKGDKTRCM